MTHKPVRPRALARRDVDDAAQHYAREGGTEIALGFIDAMEAAYRSIAAQPAAGSPRYGYELSLPGLRSRTLGRYPYIVFYVEHPDHIDVLRVLHAKRDIPALMR